jgi:large subunit ribosomal protein L28
MLKYQGKNNKSYPIRRNINMSRVCSVCGKGKLSGNLVSHSNRKTPKLYEANLQKVTVKHENGSTSKEYVCTRCLKSGKVERA